jgi:hypothetical protein
MDLDLTIPMPAMARPMRRLDDHAALLFTFPLLSHALYVLVERVLLQRDTFVQDNGVPLLTEDQLAQVRTLAMAMLVKVLDDMDPGLGRRLDTVLFPEDVA